MQRGKRVSLNQDFADNYVSELKNQEPLISEAILDVHMAQAVFTDIVCELKKMQKQGTDNLTFLSVLLELKDLHEEYRQKLIALKEKIKIT